MEKVLTEGGLYRIYISLANNMGIKKAQAIDFIWSNWSKSTYKLDRIDEENPNCMLCYLQDEPDRGVVYEELMHIPEDTQVLLECMSK